MSARIAFIVPGRPAPQVRMTQRGVHAKDHPKRAAMDRYLKFKDDVGWAAKQAMAEAGLTAPLAGEVFLSLTFARRKNGRQCDLSNLIKAAEDGLNKIIFADDVQVTALEADILTVDSEAKEHTYIVVEEEGE